MRGLGYVHGKGVYIPPPERPQERNAFIRVTFLSFLRNFLVLDFLEAQIKLFPGVGSPYGGSIFYPDLPPLQRYVVSTYIHSLSGSALLAGFGMVYDLCTLIGVALYGGAPAAWPPIMDHPFAADSLHGFWAKRWHQTLRRVFLVYGAPIAWVLSLPVKALRLAGIPSGRRMQLEMDNLVLVLATFLASGLYHETSIYVMARGFDPLVIAFFAMQAPLLLVERVWRALTGKRVGGPWGRTWVYVCIFFLAQPLSKSLPCLPCP